MGFWDELKKEYGQAREGASRLAGQVKNDFNKAREDKRNAPKFTGSDLGRSAANFGNEALFGLPSAASRRVRDYVNDEDYARRHPKAKAAASIAGSLASFGTAAPIAKGLTHGAKAALSNMGILRNIVKSAKGRNLISKGAGVAGWLGPEATAAVLNRKRYGKDDQEGS